VTHRYAIYYAPQSDDPWWEFGCQWLGRDPAAKVSLSQPAIDGLSAERLETLTRLPRRYGFHATMKSPFMLADDRSESELIESLHEFAQTQRAVLLRDMHATLQEGFVALRPSQCPSVLYQLAQNCVERFDAFRAPLTPEERQRRLAHGLTPEQVGLLERWGYPFVGPAYRFHLTLTDTVQASEADVLCTYLYGEMRRRALKHLLIDNVALFVEPEPKAPFELVRRFSLCG
jgi:putative phosphonate metabolism protein